MKVYRVGKQRCYYHGEFFICKQRLMNVEENVLFHILKIGLFSNDLRQSTLPK